MISAYFSLGFVRHLPSSIVLLLIIGFFIQLINVPLFAYMQTTTEANMIGKVMSMFLSVGTGLTPFSFVLILIFYIFI